MVKRTAKAREPIVPVVDKMPIDRARGSAVNQYKSPMSSAIYCSYSIYGHAPSLQWTVETLCLTWYYERLILDSSSRSPISVRTVGIRRKATTTSASSLEQSCKVPYPLGKCIFKRPATVT